MKIFSDVEAPSPKRGKKKYSKRPRLSKREVFEKLHPMAYSLLSIKAQEERPNKWISDTFSILNNSPEKFSDKWISRVNSWTEDLIRSAMLDAPDIEVGKRTDIGPIIIHKIIPPNNRSEYPMPAIICIDKRGWKWYFKTTKAFSFKEGSMISFVATVSAHKEGITFLKRASKILETDA